MKKTDKIKQKYGSVLHYCATRGLHLSTVRMICAGVVKGRVAGSRAALTVAQMKKDGVW